jgi:hypothetical protein
LQLSKREERGEEDCDDVDRLHIGCVDRELPDSQFCTSINSSAPNNATTHRANVFHDLVFLNPLTT